MPKHTGARGVTVAIDESGLGAEVPNMAHLEVQDDRGQVWRFDNLPWSPEQFDRFVAVQTLQVLDELLAEQARTNELLTKLLDGK